MLDIMIEKMKNKSRPVIEEIEKLIIFLEKEKSLVLLFIVFFLNTNFVGDFGTGLNHFKQLKKENEAILVNVIELKKAEYSLLLKKENALIFKLKLYMPKLHKFNIVDLVIWIYNVEIIAQKITKDNNKQFFYLIYKFQKEKEEVKKIELLILILRKIQLYIKHAK